MLFGDQFVLRIDRDLSVIADADLGMGCHRASVRVGERNLALAAGLQLLQHRLVDLTLFAHLRDLRRQCIAPSGRASLLAAVGVIQLREVFIEPLVGGLDVLVELGFREVALAAVHRLQPRAVHRQQLAPEQVELAAQEHEGAEDRLERGTVVAAEVGDGLEVRPQPAQQPDHLQVAYRFRLQATARPHAVEIAVQVQLQHIARIIARSPRRLRPRPQETCIAQIKIVDEGIDEAHRVVRRYVILNRCRKQQRLVARVTLDIRHARSIRRSAARRNHRRDFSHSLERFRGRVNHAAMSALTYSSQPAAGFTPG